MHEWIPKFHTQQPAIDFKGEILVTFPIEHTILITFNRPEKLNSFWIEAGAKLSALLDWADAEREIWCIVFTGTGRAFCCGADLAAWLVATEAGKGGVSAGDTTDHKKTGYLGFTRRMTVTPVIAAVNGLCLGGGVEIIANYASQGVLPRLIRNIGRQRASEIALLGKSITAQHALSLGLINRIVPHAQVLSSALEWAKLICESSPDSVRLTKMSFNAALTVANVEDAVDIVNESEESVGLTRGANSVEGLRAFVEKRKPKWVSSKL